MDTVKTLMRERHFFTAELHLDGLGDVVLVGEPPAVKHLLSVLRQHGGRDLTEAPDTLAEDR